MKVSKLFMCTIHDIFALTHFPRVRIVYVYFPLIAFAQRENIPFPLWRGGADGVFSRGVCVYFVVFASLDLKERIGFCFFFFPVYFVYGIVNVLSLVPSIVWLYMRIIRMFVELMRIWASIYIYICIRKLMWRQHAS